MDLRMFVDRLQSMGKLQVIEREVDPYLEMARVIHTLGERPVLFLCVRGSSFPVIAGLCSTREQIALGLEIEAGKLLPTLAGALRQPVEPQCVDTAPCQEVVEPDVDLMQLPVNTHFAEDGGPYVTTGVVVMEDPDLGRNVSYHRLQRLDRRHFAVRIVEGRGMHTAWSKTGEDLPVAVCIGNSMPVLLAGAMSPAPGVDELSIANALGATPVVKCVTSNLEIPAHCEIVLEGRLTHELVEEGPFVDLTETRDIVRLQPVLEVDCITHRSDAIYQTLLPGGCEHKLLMGLPREPSIFEAVNEVCRCLNVSLTAGGGHWLHAVVQISKQDAADGSRAIGAAFKGHSSLKHVVVVDESVDLFDPQAVEWAIATRFQADSDLNVLHNQPSSSLDPSATQVPGKKARTAKMGLDATVKWDSGDKQAQLGSYEKVQYESVELGDYLPGPQD